MHPTRVYVTGACAGLAEVRQALSEHPSVEVLGASVDPAKADEAIKRAEIVLHGTPRGDRLPTSEIEALSHATPAPIVLLTSATGADGLLRDAIAAGIADVVLLPQLTDALVFSIRKATQTSVAAAHAPATPGGAAVATSGRVYTIFSPKGGVGKSVIAAGLAVQLARIVGGRSLLVDLDLQFGDLAIMLGVDPDATIYDIVSSSGDLDADKLRSSVLAHPSGIDLVAAPVRPEDAELIPDDRVGHLLDVARKTYEAIVVDTPAFFQSSTLVTLDRTDRLLLVTSLDIPSVKNTKLALQTLSLLHYPRERIELIVNHTGARSELPRRDVEKALDLEASHEISFEKNVGDAVNRGVPVPIAAPRSAATKALGELAGALRGAAPAAPAAGSKRRGSVPRMKRPKDGGEGGTRKAKRPTVRLKKAA